MEIGIYVYTRYDDGEKVIKDCEGDMDKARIYFSNIDPADIDEAFIFEIKDLKKGKKRK